MVTLGWTRWGRLAHFEQHEFQQIQVAVICIVAVRLWTTFCPTTNSGFSGRGKYDPTGLIKQIYGLCWVLVGASVRRSVVV